MNLPRSFVLAALLTVPLAAQAPRIQIQSLAKLGASASEVVDVTLEGPTLRMASKLVEKDPDARQMMQGIKGIYVKSFTFDKPEAYASADVEAIRAQLQGATWSRIVSVQEQKGKASTEVFLSVDAGGNPQGLAILVLEPKELTVVNLVGSIDLDRLSAMEGKFGIPALGLESSRKGAAHGKK